jgi:hypothetical protein
MEQRAEKLTGPRLVNKLPVFYGTRRFITTFTSTRHYNGILSSWNGASSGRHTQRVAANILNKQSWTESNLGFGRSANNASPSKHALLWNTSFLPLLANRIHYTIASYKLMCWQLYQWSRWSSTDVASVCHVESPSSLGLGLETFTQLIDHWLWLLQMNLHLKPSAL